jgi:hypothetical protein
MMACSAKCHKIAKKQKQGGSTSNLATLQPQTDTDMADAEIAAITKSKDFPRVTERISLQLGPTATVSWPEAYVCKSLVNCILY